jgi:uncharacterized protein (TIGR00369 family)
MADDLETTLRALLASGPFHELLRLELVGYDATVGAVDLRLPWRREFERAADTKQWHGGPIAALIDIAGDFALVAVLGRGIPTIDLRIDYVRPAIATDLRATGRTVRAGRSIGVVDVEVRDDGERIVALGRGTYSTLPPGPRA